MWAARALAWLETDDQEGTYGARSLKQVIQRSLQNPLAGLILEGVVKEGETTVRVTGADGLVINGQLAEATWLKGACLNEGHVSLLPPGQRFVSPAAKVFHDC